LKQFINHGGPFQSSSNFSTFPHISDEQQHYTDMPMYAADWTWKQLWAFCAF